MGWSARAVLELNSTQRRARRQFAVRVERGGWKIRRTSMMVDDAVSFEKPSNLYVGFPRYESRTRAPLRTLPIDLASGKTEGTESVGQRGASG